jgi:hypothetical protein
MKHFILRLGSDAVTSQDPLILRQAIIMLAQNRLSSTGLASADLETLTIALKWPYPPPQVLDRFKNLVQLGLDGLKVDLSRMDVGPDYRVWPLGFECEAI